MRNVFKKLTAMGLSTLVVGMTSIPAFAEEIPEPDENGVYGQAGVAWMIMDWWDYRRGTAEMAMDEYGANEISSTYHDVNITGNGSYTVDMSGYNCKDWSGQDYNCGYLGLYIDLPLVSNEDEENPQMVCTLDDITIDGVTYTFLEQPQPEDPDSQDSGMLLKVKNGYGEPALTEPAMDNAAWTTNDPITINFTITGLPTDKIEGYADETVEKISGYGSLDNDPAMDIGGDSEAETGDTEDSAAEGDDAAATGDENKTDGEAATVDAASSAASSAASDSSSDSDGLSTGAIVGICAACGAVIAAVIALVVKKKD